MQTEYRVIKCPICDGHKTFFKSVYRHKHDYFSNKKIYGCNNCGLYFVNPKIEDSKLNKYNSSYHENAHQGHKRNKKLEAFFSGISKLRIEIIKNNSLFKENSNLKVLEVGPGPGAFAKEWLKYFPNSKYYAIESDKILHNQLKKNGINIIDNVDNKWNVFFDLIVISHVLEHVNDPLEFLNNYTKTLKKGGLIFLEVPCSDFMHKAIDEPHLLFFEKIPIKKMIKNLKLDLIKLGYYGTPIRKINSLRSKFFKKIRSFLWVKNITYYHPQKDKLNKILNNEIETEALLNFDAHIEQDEPSWWLRVIAKK